MHKVFSLGLFCYLFFACSSPHKIPDDVLGIDTMKVIMWDMIRAGELAQNSRRDSVEIKVKYNTLFQQVFNLYGITRDEFYNSFRYYEGHPDKHKILMDSLNAYGNRKRMENFKRMR